MLYQRYIDIIREIETYAFFPQAEMSREEYQAYLSNCAARIHSLCSESGHLLNDEILPLLDHIETQPRETIDQLVEFAGTLMNRNNHLDISLCCRIHEAVLHYARLQDDFDLIIQELYNCGMATYYIRQDFVSTQSVDYRFLPYRNEYFWEAASYADHWWDIESEKTMDYILRCYGNRTLGQCTYSNVRGYIQNCQQALALFGDPALQARFPSLKWDQYIFAIYRNITVVEGIIREVPVDRDIIELAEKAACYIVDHLHADSVTRPRWLCSMYAAQYHAGHRPLRSLLHEMKGLADRRNRFAYTEADIWDNIYLPILYLYYLHRASESRIEEAEEIRLHYNGEEQRVFEEFFDYCAHFSAREYKDYMLMCVRKVITGTTAFSRLTDIDKILYTIMRFHEPTYIHCEIVAEICVMLADALIDREPERFTGLLQVSSPEEVVARRQEVLDFVRQTGRLHDIGKLFCLSVISTYHRRLSQQEFQLIQNHPTGSYLVLISSEQTARYAQPALLHHRSYDGKHGYPEAPEGFVRDPALDVVTDLLTVADSMDAATDFIGRSYAKGVSFDRLMGEYRQGYNTRYAGYVVDLLQDDLLREKLRQVVYSYRSELYYQCFCAVNAHKDS